LAASPPLIWLVMGTAAAVAFGLDLSFLPRIRAIRSLGATLPHVKSTTAFFYDNVLRDRTGRERSIRINMFLTGEKVIVWLLGLVAVGIWIFVWFAVIIYGYLLYVWFSIVLLVLAFARPSDAFESFIISGRYLRSPPSEISSDEVHLLSDMAKRMSRATWFFVGLGAWLASTVAIDYLFGLGVADWLTTATGAGSSDMWRVSIFLFSVFATFAASYLVWRPKDLSLEFVVAGKAQDL
jgi:hypothetical protein